MRGFLRALVSFAAKAIVALAFVCILAQILWPLPTPQTNPPRQPFTPTAFSQAVDRLQQGDAGSSGIHGLIEGREAFAARILLAQAAQRTLDAQYYIWHGDFSGKLLLAEMLKAAKRGVKVRILIDDNTTPGEDELLAVVGAQENVELRLFNPFTIRKFRILNYLSDFPRLNRRMHNKSMTADGTATIVGGRNIGNEYMAAGNQMQYADLDVLAFGPVARDVGAQFDDYWESEAAYPINRLIAVPGAEVQQKVLADLAATSASQDGQDYYKLARETPLIQAIINGTRPLEWTRAELIVDPPSKCASGTEKDKFLLYKLIKVLGEAKQKLAVATAYFVPAREGTDYLGNLQRSGISVVLLTNSLASNDVLAVHAGYQKYRDDLLRSGVTLFELKPTPGDDESAFQDFFNSLKFNASSASLHAKTFVLDDKQVFISSFNFDPRSLYLNCEIGIVVDSPALAQKLNGYFEALTQHQAYSLELRDGRIVWHDGAAEFTTEPEANWAKRAAASVISLLPVEWML